MGQRLIISENERSQIAKMYGLVNEKANMEKQVAGPFSRKGQEAVKYYIYQIGSKFYIYQTNASHKEPTLMDGTDWDNDGKGYPNKMEAQKIIDRELKDPHFSSIKMKPKGQMNEQSVIKPSTQEPEFPKDDEFINKLPNTPDGGKRFTPDFGSADVIYPNGKTKSGKCWCSEKSGIIIAGCDGIENHCKGATYLPNRI